MNDIVDDKLDLAFTSYLSPIKKSDSWTNNDGTEMDLSWFHYIVVARRDILDICEVANELLRIREFNNARGREKDT